MMLAPRLGVMEGRLLPKYKGRYQAHPKDSWADEFAVAASFGLGLIEFILDYEDAADNPLLADGGIAAIRSATARTSVGVKSICADYFMEAPLHAADPVVAEASREVLLRLLENGAALGVTDVVIPCVDHATLRIDGGEDRFVAMLKRILPAAERLGVNLSLETDLDSEAFGRLLARLPERRVTVNYDIGNSASWGYDPKAEFAAYGPRISDLHIKDRVLGGGSVELGTGHADIPAVLALVKAVGFAGPVIMQAFRDDEGLAVFGRQLDWFRARWAEAGLP